jgi:hypothetical protein
LTKASGSADGIVRGLFQLLDQALQITNDGRQAFALGANLKQPLLPFKLGRDLTREVEGKLRRIGVEGFGRWIWRRPRRRLILKQFREALVLADGLLPNVRIACI